MEKLTTLIKLFEAQPTKRQVGIVLGILLVLYIVPARFMRGQHRAAEAARKETAPQVQQPAPKPDRLISSADGMNFYAKGGSDCLSVQGQWQQYLEKTGKTVWSFKEEVKQKTGKSCVLFE